MRTVQRQYLIFIPREETEALLSHAEEKSPDKNDAPYFAVAMLMGAAIWSNDALLKRQEEVRVYTSSELLDMFSR